MTQDEKEILMIDLCGRLSYGVKCIDITPLEQFQDKNLWEIDRVRADVMELGISNCYVCYGNYINIHNIKPYLFPLSSMTEEQKEEFDRLYTYDALIIEPQWELIDFCNKHHLDYRGLIPLGLAIDATNQNVY